LTEAVALAAGRAYRERSISARDGLDLYARDYGDQASRRTPLLCLPGFTRNSNDFHETALRHAPARRVVCPDLRGRGRSGRDANPAHYAPMAVLEDVLDVVDALGIARMVVLGAPFGGFLAMGIGTARPRALAGVILNDVGPDIERKEMARIAGYIAENRPQPDWETAARHAREAFGRDWDRQDDATWLKLARQSYTEGPDGQLHLDYDPAIGLPLQAMMRGRGRQTNLWRLFIALRQVPTLVLRGERSRILTEATLARMIEAKPDLMVARIPGIGHMPLLDEPESIEAIDGFLARF
jgi:pimeloyl-ACP methyl ester carboxylesterase